MTRSSQWAETQSWARAMAACEQDAQWHAEGDVWTHTKMVCDQLTRLDEWESLDDDDRRVLLLTALFHDAAKPLTTILDPETGHVRSPNHAVKGEHLVRGVLRELECPLDERERVCSLVRYHGRPAFVLEREDTAKEVVRLSWLSENRLLYLFALADTRGRDTDSMSRPEDNLHCYKLLAEENRLLRCTLSVCDRPRPTRVLPPSRTQSALRPARRLLLHGDDDVRLAGQRQRHVAGQASTGAACRVARRDPNGNESRSDRRPRPSHPSRHRAMPPAPPRRHLVRIERHEHLASNAFTLDRIVRRLQRSHRVGLRRTADASAYEAKPRPGQIRPRKRDSQIGGEGGTTDVAGRSSYHLCLGSKLCLLAHAMSKYEWLSIRETMDGRFRSSRLAHKFIEHANKTRLIIDLGCGTGTNYRYLTRNDGSDTPWLCVDSDGDVLEIAAGELAGKPVRFELGDLAADISLIPISEDVAITASAFFDLTSEDWIVRFANLVAGSPLLISMTASGASAWDPIDDMDEAIEICLQTHRKADHCFGPAAGLSAARLLAEQLIARNCSVSLEASDWSVDHQDREVMATLIDGVRRRALSQLPHNQVERWAATRRQQNQAGVLKLTLPHLDLLSLPQRT